MSSLEKLKEYLLPHPRPLIGAETIQLVVLREVLDYTVLRTEDTRELNSAHTPLSIGDRGTVVKRVAFLGSKQKAAESRCLEQMLRTATNKAGKSVPNGKNSQGCFLKDNLCLNCPRCILFGGSALSNEANIKHRIEYATAFSLLPFEEVSDEITFNAVNEDKQTTGQALGTRFVVKPGTLFPSVITLKSVTKTELQLAVKMLLACKSYGAESRIGGDCRNSLFAVAAGWEEIITPLELTLELYEHKDSLTSDSVRNVLETAYKPLAGNPSRVQVLSSADVDSLAAECAGVDPNKEFLDGAYADAAAYRAAQAK